MRTPTRSMAPNLRWTRTGGVWADFLLTDLPYGLRPVNYKQAVRALHQALFRALPGESLLLGLCSGLHRPLWSRGCSPASPWPAALTGSPNAKRPWTRWT